MASHCLCCVSDHCTLLIEAISHQRAGLDKSFDREREKAFDKNGLFIFWPQE